MGSTRLMPQQLCAATLIEIQNYPQHSTPCSNLITKIYSQILLNIRLLYLSKYIINRFLTVFFLYQPSSSTVIIIFFRIILSEQYNIYSQ